MKEVAYDNDDEDGQKMVTNSMKEANHRIGLTHYKTRWTEVY
jgi:transposase